MAKITGPEDANAACLARFRGDGIVPAMETSIAGEACALAAALTWAFGLMLFKLSGDHVPPLPLNFFKSTVALVLLLATLMIEGEWLTALARFPNADIAILLFSGVVGIALADTVFFHSLNLIGVGLSSIVDCLYSPFVILFSFLLLSENLTLSHFLGTGLIIAGVLVSSRHTPPADRTRGQIVIGMLLGGLAMALMTFGIVIAKPVLDAGVNGFPLIWATMFRLLAGSLTLALLALASPQRRAYWAVFRPSPIWRVSLPGSLIGGYLAMILWVAGFKYTEAASAGILNQSSIIFAIILATVILKESFTRRKLASVTLALIGVVIVTLGAF